MDATKQHLEDEVARQAVAVAAEVSRGLSPIRSALLWSVAGVIGCGAFPIH